MLFFGDWDDVFACVVVNLELIVERRVAGGLGQEAAGSRLSF